MASDTAGAAAGAGAGAGDDSLEEVDDEELHVLDVITSDYELFQKVIVVLAANVDYAELLRESLSGFVAAIGVFGRGVGGDGSSGLASAAGAGAGSGAGVTLDQPTLVLEMGRHLPLFQHMSNFAQRCNAVALNMVQQLAALHSKREMLYTAIYVNVKLHSAFASLGELLTMLIVLDGAIARNAAIAEAWELFKREVQLASTPSPATTGSAEEVGGHPAMSEALTQQEQMKRLCAELDGGCLSESGMFEQCVAQDFQPVDPDTGVPLAAVRTNETFLGELLGCTLELLDRGVAGAAAAPGCAKDVLSGAAVVGAFALYVLHRNLMPRSQIPDVAVYCRLWSTQLQVPVVALPGQVTWSADKFLLRYSRVYYRFPPKKLDPRDCEAHRLDHATRLAQNLGRTVAELNARCGKLVGRLGDAADVVLLGKPSEATLRARGGLLMNCIEVSNEAARAVLDFTHGHLTAGKGVSKQNIGPLVEAVMLQYTMRKAFQDSESLLADTVRQLLPILCSDVKAKLHPAVEQLRRTRRASHAQRETLAAIELVSTVLQPKSKDGSVSSLRHLATRLAMSVASMQGSPVFDVDGKSEGFLSNLFSGLASEAEKRQQGWLNEVYSTLTEISMLSEWRRHTACDTTYLGDALFDSLREPMLRAATPPDDLRRIFDEAARDRDSRAEAMPHTDDSGVSSEVVGEPAGPRALRLAQQAESALATFHTFNDPLPHIIGSRDFLEDYTLGLYPDESSSDGDSSLFGGTHGGATDGASGSHPAPRLVREHPDLKKWFKMIDMGIPRQVVEQKMMLAGVGPSVLDRGDEHLNDDGSMAGGTPVWYVPPEAVEAGAGQVADAASSAPPELRKWFKMIDMGIPREVVEQKMRLAGEDPAVLDRGDEHSDDEGSMVGATRKVAPEPAEAGAVRTAARVSSSASSAASAVAGTAKATAAVHSAAGAAAGALGDSGGVADMLSGVADVASEIGKALPLIGGLFKAIGAVRTKAQAAHSNVDNCRKICDRLNALETPLRAVEDELRRGGVSPDSGGVLLPALTNLQTALAEVEAVVDAYAGKGGLMRTLGASGIKRKFDTADSSVSAAVADLNVALGIAERADIQRLLSSSAVVLDVAVAVERVEGKLDAAREQTDAFERDVRAQLGLLLRVYQHATSGADVTPARRAREAEPRYLIPWGELAVEPGRVLGRGAFGDVRAARYSGSPVAVKTLRAEFVDARVLKALNREALVLSGLPRHPSLVVFYGAVAEDPHYGLVTEYLAGGTLSDALALVLEPSELRWWRRLQIAEAVAAGVAQLHAVAPPQGPIAHGDLKSGNVMLESSIAVGRVALVDFGLSMVTAETSRTSSGSGGEGASSSSSGTVRWSAPERLGRTPTAAADVYSLGSLLWEIGSRQTPYEHASSDADVRHLLASGVLPDTADIDDGAPAGFADLVTSCWATAPGDRPTAAGVLDALRAMRRLAGFQPEGGAASPFAARLAFTSGASMGGEGLGTGSGSAAASGAGAAGTTTGAGTAVSDTTVGVVGSGETPSTDTAAASTPASTGAGSDLHDWLASAAFIRSEPARASAVEALESGAGIDTVSAMTAFVAGDSDAVDDVVDLVAEAAGIKGKKPLLRKLTSAVTALADTGAGGRTPSQHDYSDL